jgi:hypothetical protein
MRPCRTPRQSGLVSPLITASIDHFPAHSPPRQRTAAPRRESFGRFFWAPAISFSSFDLTAFTSSSCVAPVDFSSSGPSPMVTVTAPTRSGAASAF